MLTDAEPLRGLGCRIAALSDLGHWVTLELVAEIGLPHHRLLSSKLGSKASRNLGATQLPAATIGIAPTAAHAYHHSFRSELNEGEMQAQKIAILGGTGALGSGIARRLAVSGWHVIIGSRTVGRAIETAAKIGSEVEGMSLGDAAAAANIAILTVPFSSQLDVIASVAANMRGKILIDATVPLKPPRVSMVQLPAEGSAAMKAAVAAGGSVRVVSAFQNVSAQLLQQDGEIDCDVLVTGDDADACKVAIAIAHDCGLRAWHAGPLANSVAAEAMTSLLIFMNKAYKARHAGIRITGLSFGSHP